MGSRTADDKSIVSAIVRFVVLLYGRSTAAGSYEVKASC